MTRQNDSIETIETIKELAALLARDGCKVTAFTGAGMSTGSGLPDFRSAKGVWSRLDPMEIATESAMRRDYDRFHEFYRLRLEQMRTASPNAGHRILADWEARGLLSCVITQNVDGLHAAAGSRKVFELHGAVGRTRCMDCALPAEDEAFIAKIPCPGCGGRLRPGVVLFSENLPEDVLNGAWNAASSTGASGALGVFLVLGSSLQVSPANQLPIAAKNAGAAIVICNHDPTPLDRIAIHATNEDIAGFLTKLDELLPPGKQK